MRAACEARVKTQFRADAARLQVKDVAGIEWYLRRGHRQLELLRQSQLTGVDSMQV